MPSTGVRRPKYDMAVLHQKCSENVAKRMVSFLKSISLVQDSCKRAQELGDYLVKHEVGRDALEIVLKLLTTTSSVRETIYRLNAAFE